MHIEGSVALVTGSNRGIGRSFVEELLARGAAKVYATARRPESIDVPGVERLQLDITDDASVTAAAARASDLDLLINNGGVSTYTDLVDGPLDRLHLEMDTHFWGTLRMVRAFAPILAGNGGGAIVNMLSRLSWVSWPGVDMYSAAKAAEWSLTNGVRLELASAGTLVTGVHVGAVDTDIMAAAGYTGPMIDPAELAGRTLQAVQDGELEVLIDDDSRRAKAALAEDPATTYAALLERAGRG